MKIFINTIECKLEVGSQSVKKRIDWTSHFYHFSREIYFIFPFKQRLHTLCFKLFHFVDSVQLYGIEISGASSRW
jgi:hypothetical protein